MSNSLKRVRITVMPFLLAALTNCSAQAPLNPIRSLSSPLGLEAASVADGPGIQLSYYGANDEDDFDGYNLYISESEDVSDIAAGKTPLLLDGLTPTIPLSPEELDTDLKREYLVIYRDNWRTPLTSGVTYYFILRAHSSNGVTSPPSNEASAIAP